MEAIYGCCGGIDVHKNMLVVCMRKGRRNTIREFGTTTSELMKMSNWLVEEGCEMTTMESTGSYWKPVMNVLEALDIPGILVNAAHMKNVPGRKTDVKDAQWIAELLQNGLLSPSFCAE